MNTVYFYMVFHRWLATTQRDFRSFILMVNFIVPIGCILIKAKFEDGNLMDKITMKSLKFTSLTKSYVYDTFTKWWCALYRGVSVYMCVLTSLNTLMQSSAHAVAMNPLHNDLASVQQNNIHCIHLNPLIEHTLIVGRAHQLMS